MVWKNRDIYGFCVHRGSWLLWLPVNTENDPKWYTMYIHTPGMYSSAGTTAHAAHTTRQITNTPACGDFFFVRSRFSPKMKGGTSTTRTRQKNGPYVRVLIVALGTISSKPFHAYVLYTRYVVDASFLLGVCLHTLPVSEKIVFFSGCESEPIHATNRSDLNRESESANRDNVLVPAKHRWNVHRKSRIHSCAGLAYASDIFRAENRYCGDRWTQPIRSARKIGWRIVRGLCVNPFRPAVPFWAQAWTAT